ncbi:MAG: DMT family transporter [Candidatus Thiodiazotropha sp. (ex Codakia rugifera)]|nr:DMT family transporter [Candidatus Thiodiazotropha sp. (ex Codakia rugifera)]
MLYKQNLLLGALFILLSELMFASMGATVKFVTQSLPSEMAVFMRNLFGLALLMPLVWSHGWVSLRTDIFPVHLLRSVAGVSAMYCFFYALAHLPLADGMLLKMTSPLFMPLIAWFWLSEPLRQRIFLAIGIGFVGVVLVLNPEGEFNRIALIGLLGGGLASLAKVSLRRLGRTEPSIRVVFYFALLSSIISAVPMFWSWQQPTPNQWAWLALIGLLGTLGQLMLTRGYAIAAAARVSPVTYSSVLFGAGYGYLFWDEGLSGQFILGALLIAIAGILAIGSQGRIDNTLVSDPTRP